MTAMDGVHMRVKPGKDDKYLRIHREMEMRAMSGVRALRPRRLRRGPLEQE